jgi:flagellar basal-body rod protein FlgC
MRANTIFASMRISAAGLSVQRQRLNAISSNIANAETTQTPEGGPYKKQFLSVVGDGSPHFDHILEKTRLRVTKTDRGHREVDPPINDNCKIKMPVAKLKEDQNEPRLEYDPSHPDADENGYVKKPNINLVTEMVDMISASRTYEANVVALNSAKGMFRDALDI